MLPPLFMTAWKLLFFRAYKWCCWFHLIFIFSCELWSNKTEDFLLMLTLLGERQKKDCRWLVCMPACVCVYELLCSFLSWLWDVFYFRQKVYFPFLPFNGMKSGSVEVWGVMDETLWLSLSFWTTAWPEALWGTVNPLLAIQELKLQNKTGNEEDLRAFPQGVNRCFRNLHGHILSRKLTRWQNNWNVAPFPSSPLSSCSCSFPLTPYSLHAACSSLCFLHTSFYLWANMASWRLGGSVDK